MSPTHKKKYYAHGAGGMTAQKTSSIQAGAKGESSRRSPSDTASRRTTRLPTFSMLSPVFNLWLAYEQSKLSLTICLIALIARAQDRSILCSALVYYVRAKVPGCSLCRPIDAGLCMQSPLTRGRDRCVSALADRALPLPVCRED